MRVAPDGRFQILTESPIQAAIARGHAEDRTELIRLAKIAHQSRMQANVDEQRFMAALTAYVEKPE